MEIVSHELELDGRRARLVLATDTTDRDPRPRRAAPERGAASPRAAHRGARPHRGRRGARLQQPAHHHPRLRRDAAARHGARRPAPARRRSGSARRPTGARCSPASCCRSAGTRPQEPRPVNLNEVVRGMEPLVQRLVGRRRAARRPAGGRARAGADRSGAARARGGEPGPQRARRDARGRPAHASRPCERRISGLSRGRPVRPGRYVVLAVGDSGERPGARPSAATPTGAPRLAAGLGARSCSGSSGSTAGWCGCPASRARAPRSRSTCRGWRPSRGRPRRATPRADSLRGSETVLVAEDEDGVRELLRKVLTEFGYTVLDRPPWARCADAGRRAQRAPSTCW